MGSKYKSKESDKEIFQKGKQELEQRLSELYEDYHKAETTADRERISSKIHNIEVKIMQLEKSKCAVSNLGGYHEISIRELANIR